MPDELLISIVICTQNRCASLRQTLEALGRTTIRSGWKAEAIVVDNASTDETAAMVRGLSLPNMPVCYFFESKKGKSNALNTGLAHARGQIILFTDDDVIIPANWIEQMLVCFADAQCDVVVGRIELAPHLSRPWVNGVLKGMLAARDFSHDHVEWVGANAGFRRSILEHVGGFDAELGPGALGLGEDTLLGWQLMEAGLKLTYAPDACVIHQPDVCRLLRREFLGAARKLGRSQAYLCYHWQHADIKAPLARLAWLGAKLRVRRILQVQPPLDSEGCSPWEFSYVHHIEMCRQFRIERRRQRNYTKRGLKRIGGQSLLSVEPVSDGQKA